MEARAGLIIHLPQSAFLRIIYRPDQVGLKGRFKGIRAQFSHTLGRVNFLAGGNLEAVDTYHPDMTAVVGGQQETLSSILTGAFTGSAGNKNGVAPVPPADGQKIVQTV